jgi:hypothetical protein
VADGVSSTRDGRWRCWVAALCTDNDQFGQVIDVNSLVSFDRQEDTLSVHRLVQLLTQLTLTAEQARHWATVALGLVNSAFPQDVVVRTSWPSCQRLLAHAIASAKHAEQFNIEPYTRAALLDRTLNYLRGRGSTVQIVNCSGRSRKKAGTVSMTTIEWPIDGLPLCHFVCTDDWSGTGTDDLAVTG